MLHTAGAAEIECKRGRVGRLKRGCHSRLSTYEDGLGSSFEEGKSPLVGSQKRGDVN